MQQAKANQSSRRSGPYKHLLTGVSYMLPVIVAGGLIIALSFAFGIKPAAGTFGDALMQIGGKSAFALIVPVLSGFIAFSIADRLGLAPGLVGGMLASNLGMGFLGGILSGFLAGYIARWIRDHVNLPVIPLLSTLAVGLLLVYVFGTPVNVLAIPNAVGRGGLYVVAIAAGTLVTALVVTQLKRRQPKPVQPVELAPVSAQPSVQPSVQSSAH